MSATFVLQNAQARFLSNSKITFDKLQNPAQCLGRKICETDIGDTRDYKKSMFGNNLISRSVLNNTSLGCRRTRGVAGTRFASGHPLAKMATVCVLCRPVWKHHQTGGAPSRVCESHEWVPRVIRERGESQRCSARCNATVKCNLLSDLRLSLLNWLFQFSWW